MLCAVIFCVSSRTRFCGLNRNIDRSFIHTGTTRPAAMNKHCCRAEVPCCCCYDTNIRSMTCKCTYVLDHEGHPRTCMIVELLHVLHRAQHHRILRLVAHAVAIQLRTQALDHCPYCKTDAILPQCTLAACCVTL
jgi:hypothetical protein